MTTCQCRTCREFDFQRWCWKYIPVRYETQRSDLATVLKMLGAFESAARHSRTAHC